MNFLYVIRQNRRRLGWAFAFCAAACLVYELAFVREYRAFAQVRAFHYSNANNQDMAAFAEDFTAHVQLVQSAGFLQGMTEGLSDEDRKELLAPLTHWFGAKETAGEVLLERRKVAPNPSLQIIDLGFQHPNPAVAVRMAKALAAEFIHQSEAMNEAQKKNMLGDLQNEVEALGKKAETLQAQMDGYVNKYGIDKLDSTQTVADFSAVQEMSRQAVDDKAALDKLNTQRQQIQQQMLAGQPVWNLSFIASQAHVQELLKSLQELLTRLDQLRQEKYADDSQPVIDLIGRINNTGTELANAADIISKQVSTDYDAAATALDKTNQRLETAKKDALELSNARNGYQALHQQLEATQKLASAKAVELSDQQAKVNLVITSYALLPGEEPTAQADSPPWVRFVLQAVGAGVGGSFLLALGLAFFSPATCSGKGRTRTPPPPPPSFSLLYPPPLIIIYEFRLPEDFPSGLVEVGREDDRNVPARCGAMVRWLGDGSG